jgi:(p)ppGpp synthase/HD superfamily hydrolase
MIWDSDLVSEALYFAAMAHQGQMRTEPEVAYIVHPADVCAELMAAFTVEPAADCTMALMCGYLHDTVEDHHATTDQIAQKFGTAVAEGVRALTKDARLPHEARMADSLRRIKTCPHEIWMVKMADRISNIRSFPASWTKEDGVEYLAEAQVILNELGTAHAYLATRLKDKIATYERLIAERN